MRRMTVLVGAVTALVLVLTGCGSDNPKPSRPASSSASPSASPSAVAPTMPAEAKGTGPEAAKAFVKHYLATFSYAARTGDVTHLRLLSAEQCTSCRDVVEQIQHVYASGGYARGKGYAAGKMRVGSNPVSVRTTVVQFPQVSKKTADSKVMKHGRSLLPSIFTLTHASGTWQVDQWERL